LLHDHVTQLLAGDLLLGALVQLGLDVGDDVVDRLDGDRALLAGLEQRAAQLLAIERLPAPIALDHVRQHVLDVLVGRVAPMALETLAPAADELAVTTDPRVDDAILGVAAERASHRGSPPGAGPLTSPGPGRAESDP